MKTNNRIKWMISLSFILFIPSTNIAQNAGQAPQTNYAQMVDTRIGSKGNGLSCGFTYIGASYPFGMMQFTPSFFSPQKGIVVNQMSGSGCPHMGNFPVLPISGKVTKSPKNMEDFPTYKEIREATAGCFAHLRPQALPAPRWFPFAPSRGQTVRAGRRRIRHP